MSLSGDEEGFDQDESWDFESGIAMGRFEMGGQEVETIFNYTPVVQTFTVPDDRTRMRVAIFGAASRYSDHWGPTYVDDQVTGFPPNSVYTYYGTWGHEDVTDTINPYYLEQDGVPERIYSAANPVVVDGSPRAYGTNNRNKRWPYGIGLSAWVMIMLPVVPGEVLEMEVGQRQTSRFASTAWPDGGRGGNASSGFDDSGAGAGSVSIRRAGTTFRDSLIVIGGAGGANDFTRSRADWAPYGPVFPGNVGLYESGWGAGRLGEHILDTVPYVPADEQGGAPGTLVGPGDGGEASSLTRVPESGYVPIGGFSDNGRRAGWDRYGGWADDVGSFAQPGGGGGGGWYGGGAGGPRAVVGGAQLSGDGGAGSSYISPTSGIEVLAYHDAIANLSTGGRVIFYL